MAAADIKPQHEEVKAKSGMGPFQIKNDEVRCKYWEAMFKYNATTTPMMDDLSNVTKRYIRPWLTSLHPPVNLPSPQYEHAAATMYNGTLRFLIVIIISYFCFLMQCSVGGSHPAAFTLHALHFLFI